MSPSPIPAQCEGCSSKFSWLRKRRTCLMCRSVCCSACMQRVRLCGVGRQCLRCTRLAGVRYERAALQQMTVRDLKHIMKIADVSSATCREKSDLVDTILMSRRSAEQSDTQSERSPLPSAPDLDLDREPAPAPTPAPAADGLPHRARPRDSSRVGPYESIRVRAMDAEEAPPSPKPAGAAGRRSASPAGSESCDDVDEDGFVVVDVETNGDGGESGVRSEPPAEGGAVDGEVDVEVEVDGPAGGSDAGEEVVVDDDPDEPQSESVTIEVERSGDPAADNPMSETGLDLSRVTDVAQIPSEELIARLTVRQCKRLLQHRRTDYRGVIEKQDLLRRVRELWHETKRNAEALATASDRDICKICMDSLIDCVMLECGHMATCTACGKLMAECPICRKYVVRVVHVFRS
ncbi:E3 ubiquitin-protein ligase rififylin-like isoform X3 [Amphibalanus amphitrite]|nr:E3 ubiquitin-protein ligase rififylin-like isoform X3 [Amphibalanus amphitrite]